jgi:uncharacterized protein YcbK (DUF882 family)
MSDPYPITKINYQFVNLQKSKKMKKKMLVITTTLLIVGMVSFIFLFNNTSLAKPEVNEYYKALKTTLQERGYKANLMVISTRRFKWFNDILVMFNGASSRSHHMKSEAIDFVVFDINGDGSANGKDVDIAYEILDKEIIKNKGGIGTYKCENNFFNRQMIHIDCRGKYGRWHR